MSYPGNPSLAQDVQERISNTFQQTLDLVTDQRDQEALVGCEFILRMDPNFQPAKTLVARLKSGQRPVQVDDLKTPPAGGPPALDALDDDLALPDDFDDLGSLDDLGDLDDLDDLALDDIGLTPAAPAAPAPTAPAPPVTSTPMAPIPGAPPVQSSAIPAAPPAASGLAAVLSDLLAKRNHERILQIAETQRQSVASDPEVSALVEKAQALFESETYVQAFLKSARQAQAQGQLEEMLSHLNKARALDPEHPDLLALVASTEASASAPAAPTAAADNDLMALQQQSLSLESEDSPPAGHVAETLARDPRKTKPMAAIPLGMGDEATPSAPAADLVAEDALFESDEPAGPSLDAELFDDAATDAAVSTLDAELLNLDGDVSGDLISEEPDDLGADLFGAGEADAPVEAPLEDLDDELMLGDNEPALADDLSLDDDDLVLGDGGEGTPETVEPAAGGDRVSELIAEGQEAFDRGEYQTAIDVWSRIFLIDIDNAEASSLIEEARSKKAELERQAEELFHEAVGHLENESLDEAKSALAKVLELAPSHSLAREYLEQLEAGKVPAIGGDVDLGLGGDGADLGGDPSAEPGSPSLEAAVARDRVVVVKKTDKRIIALGAAVLLAVLGLGSFLMLKWDDLFPNQEAPPTGSPMARKVDPIERATKMHEGDNTENAILLLERIQPQDPIYEDAQALIAQWKALVEAPPELEETGPSEEQAERYRLLVGAAREAHSQGRRIRARKYYERAAKILPLSAEDMAIKSEGDQQLASLEKQIKLFDESQYSAIIPELWRRREKDPDNLDLQRLLVDSYYNLALTDMQRGNIQAAAKKLREALEVQPENQELQRLQLFAQTYTQRRQDLLYRIFVKYLPSR